MNTKEATRIRVLVVVEDDPDMQLLIQLMLGAEPLFEFCGAAATACEAIALAQAKQPELIVLDHFIEGQMMGLQAAPLIKAVAPDVHIILFTSHDLAVEVNREPSIDIWLRKSDIGKLLPTARNLLGLKASAN